MDIDGQSVKVGDCFGNGTEFFCVYKDEAPPRFWYCAGVWPQSGARRVLSGAVFLSKHLLLKMDRITRAEFDQQLEAEYSKIKALLPEGE